VGPTGVLVAGGEVTVAGGAVTVAAGDVAVAAGDVGVASGDVAVAGGVVGVDDGGVVGVLGGVVGLGLPHVPSVKLTINPLVRPPVLHSYWVKLLVSFCTPTVALAPWSSIAP